MESADAASRDMERGLLVATPYAAEEGLLSQDTPSRHAPIQAAREAQDAPCAAPVVAPLIDEWRPNMRTLADRIEVYLNDAPLYGGHSDAADANCWELLREAMEELRELTPAPAPEPDYRPQF
jgi:hypothetical protein